MNRGIPNILTEFKFLSSKPENRMAFIGERPALTRSVSLHELQSKLLVSLLGASVVVPYAPIQPPFKDFTLGLTWRNVGGFLNVSDKQRGPSLRRSAYLPSTGEGGLGFRGGRGGGGGGGVVARYHNACLLAGQE